jgi:hypothetical protein
MARKASSKPADSDSKHADSFGPVLRAANAKRRARNIFPNGDGVRGQLGVPLLQTAASFGCGANPIFN